MQQAHGIVVTKVFILKSFTFTYYYGGCWYVYCFAIGLNHTYVQKKTYSGHCYVNEGEYSCHLFELIFQKMCLMCMYM